MDPGSACTRLAQLPPVFICTPPLGHYLIVTSLLDQIEVIIRPMDRGQSSLGLLLPCVFTHGIQKPKCHSSKRDPPQILGDTKLTPCQHIGAYPKEEITRIVSKFLET
ncbi:hypothetical protein O181_041607 [Austropuccinia psidii MF-1]|uniref:Uncharacterized protein n=1 Tax=Austropuccinia psidii MF-1 TaxID=1389203 RepID=A0A9Q3DH14_9BASI|nr:hypothetical protein [Austropuccinia psidii MF-1]